MPLGFNNSLFEAPAPSGSATDPSATNLSIDSSHATQLEGRYTGSGNGGLAKHETMKATSDDDIEAESRPPYLHVCDTPYYPVHCRRLGLLKMNMD